MSLCIYKFKNSNCAHCFFKHVHSLCIYMFMIHLCVYNHKPAVFYFITDKKNNAKYIIREIDTTTVCYVWSNHRHFCLKHFISKYFSLISEYIFFIVYLTNSICLLKLQITWNLSKLGSSLHESHLGICMGTFGQISYVPYRPLLIPTDNFTSYHTIFDLKY